MIAAVIPGGVQRLLAVTLALTTVAFFIMAATRQARPVLRFSIGHGKGNTTHCSTGGRYFEKCVWSSGVYWCLSYDERVSV